MTPNSTLPPPLPPAAGPGSVHGAGAPLPGGPALPPPGGGQPPLPGDGMTPATRRVLLGLGGIVAVSMIAALTASAVGAIFSTTATGSQPLDDLPSALTVTTDAGDVHVRASTDGRPHVQWTSRYTFHKPTVTLKRDGDRLTVDTDCSGFQLLGCSVDLDLQVPAELDVTTKSSAGTVTVTGLHGDVVADSSAGDVTVEDITGTVHATSSAGDVTGRRLLVTSATAESTAGDVNITFAAPPERVSARSSAGDVRVVLPEGERLYAVKAGTSAGDTSIEVKTSSESPFTIDAHSSAGDVSVRYPG